jgi:hypothetical protein
MITLAMWIHTLLNMLTTFSPTKNPIWGELRLVVVMITTLALWCGFWLAIQ